MKIFRTYGDIDSILDNIEDRKAELEWLGTHFTDRKIKAEVIADFGCCVGDGTIGLAWALASSKVVGIDKNEQAISEASKLVAKVQPNKPELEGVDFQFMHGNMVSSAPPLEASTFDVAHCERVLDKIWCEGVRPHEDTLQAIKEMARVTKSGGVVIAIEGEWCDPGHGEKRLDLAPLFKEIDELEKIFVKSRAELSDERAQPDPSRGDTYVYLYRKRERVEERQG